MRAGTLRHRVSIQIQTGTPDGLGGETLAWSNVSGLSSVPAAIWPLSSRESLDAMKLESVVSAKVRIRYTSGITSKHRIVFGTRIFNILGDPINYEERNKYLDMLVSEDS